MKADAGVERAAHRPLFFDERPELGVVRVRRVLLKAECGSHEIDAHVERLAQRQHGRSRFGSRQTRELVDRQLAQIASSDLGRERRFARGAIFVVTALHFRQRRPHRGQKCRELPVVEREANRRHTRANAIDEIGRHVSLTHAGASAGATVCASSGDKSNVM